MANNSAPFLPASTTRPNHFEQSSNKSHRKPVTIESAAYALILILAVVTRFWNLGARALHHDESLHAYFSWLYATGEGYVHDAMMHGPFLFHGNALVYLLFGVTDATTRYLPALCGVALVGLPYFLRGPRLLGQWGALLSSLFLLVSPSIFYYSRFIRHDIYTAVGTLLLFICIFRYLEQPSRRWLIISGITIGFLVSNHEIFFAVFAIFAGFFYCVFIWERIAHSSAPKHKTILPIVVLHGLVSTIAFALIHFSPREYRSRLTAIPWDSAGVRSLPPTGPNQLHYYYDLLVNPLIISFLVVIVIFALGLWRILARIPIDLDKPQGQLSTAIRHLMDDPDGLAIAIGSSLVIAVTLFTSLFSNFIDGLGTATLSTNGTLLYWLGQHDVRRGAEPWFYFLLLMPQYELLGFFIGGLAAVIITGQALLALRPGHTASMPSKFRLLLVAWFGGMFLGLSWAGEKMPWLVVHIAVPAILLAAVLLGDAISKLGKSSTIQQLPIRHVAAGTMALLIASGGLFFAVARYTRPLFSVTSDGLWIRTTDTSAINEWWRVVVPLLLSFLVLSGLLLRLGLRPTTRIVICWLIVSGVFLQIHLGWQTTYQDGDVAKTMLIYNTTAPDVTQLVANIGQLSETVNGGKDLAIWYNSCAAWPFYWYLRDFSNSQSFDDVLPAQSPIAPIIIASETGGCPSLGSQLPGYTRQDYVLRWAFPEDSTYRNFAIAPELQPGDSAWKDPEAAHGPRAVLQSIMSSISTLGTPAGQQKLYRLWIYRELPEPTWNYPVTLYIRNDLWPIYSDLRY